MSKFSVSYDGLFCQCSSLHDPATIYNIPQDSQHDAWVTFTPRARVLTSQKRSIQQDCCSCPNINLWLRCPAHAKLEPSDMNGWSKFSCRVAYARARIVEEWSDRAWVGAL